VADPEAFLAHVGPLRPQLIAYARRMLRDPQGLQDVLQSALQVAYAKFDLYAEGSNFRAWIFRILTLEIFQANRRHERWEQEVPLDAVSEDLVVALDLELDYDRLLERMDTVYEHLEVPLGRALLGLPPRERSALLLRAVADLSYKEIAQSLGIPVGSALGYLSRARVRLRRELAAYAAERGLLRGQRGQEDRP
jgi:RNA polymerase sigma-70 factor (ECF subfamily)